MIKVGDIVNLDTIDGVYYVYDVVNNPARDPLWQALDVISQSYFKDGLLIMDNLKELTVDIDCITVREYTTNCQLNLKETRKMKLRRLLNGNR